jgi:3-hydroxybutyryl-CoA dehydrogenase
MRAIDTIAVIGAGTMGRGIAQLAATSGFSVRIVDADEEALSRGVAAIADMLGVLVEKKKLLPAERGAALRRLSPAASIEEGVADADLVVEAVPEEIDLASNTSSLSIGRIADATRRPSSCVGMHFFNPVPVMPLLEVVRGDATSEETVSVALEVGRRLGKEPIVVRDTPGFATSRLGVLLGLEAIRMLEQGVASAEDIDKAMTLGYRHPMGPLRLTDLVGLDVRLAIAEHLHHELRSEAFRPPDLLRRMVAEGKIGKKCGEGFYRWDA